MGEGDRRHTVKTHPPGIPTQDRKTAADERATLFPGSETYERKVAPLWETVLMTVLLSVRIIPETLLPGSGGEFDAHFMWIFVGYLFDWPMIGLMYTAAYFVLHCIIHYLIRFFSFRRFQRPPPKLKILWGLLLMYVVGMVAGELVGLVLFVSLGAGDRQRQILILGIAFALSYGIGHLWMHYRWNLRYGPGERASLFSSAVSE